MSQAQAQFRQALIDGNDDELHRLWTAIFPGLPRPSKRDDIVTTMHIARTAADCVPDRGRFYSHRWLEERGLPSRLPMNLRPKCDQYYAGVTPAVGFAYGTDKEWLKPAKPLIERAVHTVIEDCAANGDLDKPDMVRDLMMDAKNDEFRRLFGAITSAEVER
jgi:hypothetical protein